MPSNILKGHPLNVNAGDEAAYRKDLRSIVSDMSKEIDVALTGFYDRELKGQETEESTVAAAVIMLAGLRVALDRIVEERGRAAVMRMAARTVKTSQGSVGRSLGAIFGGFVETTVNRQLKAKVEAAIVENLRLIKSIEDQYLTQVEGALMRNIISGGPKKDIVAVLVKQKGISGRRANNIANDQIHKIYNSVAAELMEDAGVTEFEWVYTYRSKARRDYHVAMNGNVYKLNNLPIIDPKTGQRGKPGDLWNCKCGMRPVVSVKS